MIAGIILIIGAALCLLASLRLTVGFVQIRRARCANGNGNATRRTAIENVQRELVAAALRSSAHQSAWSGWRPMQIVRIEGESTDCKSFYLRDPDDRPLPPYVPGQFLTVRLPVDGDRWVSRCYSLSDAPASQHYRLTIRRVSGGKCSTLLHDTIQVGDLLEVRAPAGQFIPASDPELPLILISAGIGVTPMVSIAKHLFRCQPERPIHFFYQIRDLTQAPLLREVARWGAENEHARLHLFLSQPSGDPPPWITRCGRIAAEDVLEICGRCHGQYMICGPPAMLQEMREGLVAAGIPNAMIAVEAFEAIKQSHLAADDRGEDLIVNANTATHPVRFAGSEKVGQCDANQRTILEAAESAGVPIDSACRSGNCGSCMVRLLEGQAPHARTPDFGPLEPGHVLACLAEPSGPVVVDA
jgi:ferredoxin-NADP reductase